jgi:hypothetical protein
VVIEAVIQVVTERPGYPCTDRSWFAGWMGSSVDSMDRRRDVKDFLASTGPGLTPEQAGLVTHGERWWVKGLGREKVAIFAGSASTADTVED